jgi:hypothetical protein
VRVFAGVVNDPFAGDATGLEVFKAAFTQGDYKPDAFANRVNVFDDRSVAAIAVEVPNQRISNAARDARMGHGVVVRARSRAADGPAGGCHC